MGGVVGNELRLLFCLGEGVEWLNDSGRILCVRPSHACLCMGDGSTERLRYGSGYGHPFHQVSIARGQAMSMIQGNYDKALAFLTSLVRLAMWVDIDVAIEVIYS